MMPDMKSLKDVGQGLAITSSSLRVVGQISSFYIAERTEGSRASLGLLRWALVVIFLWFGVSKFTGHKLGQFTQWVAHSPIISWLPDLFGVEGASYVIGCVELSTAVALIAGAFNGYASALGAAMSCATYLITLSFLLTTPDVSGSTVAGFLLKDLVLLAASFCLLDASFKLNRLR